MDDRYRAKLTASPPVAKRVHNADADCHPGRIINLQATVGAEHSRPSIPVHLPDIYINPYPPVPPPLPAQAPTASHEPAPTERDADPSKVQSQSLPSRSRKLGSFTLTQPHPLLWVSLILSLIALVLGVPKGTLPTITGRHKALRAQEKLVAERLALLTTLSTFLPPPLSTLIDSGDAGLFPVADSFSSDNDSYLRRLTPQLRFWSAAAREDAPWWSVEELGHGASVVRSRHGDREKEVWVLKMGDGKDDSGTLPLTSAFTHSLVLRDRLQAELVGSRQYTCPVSRPAIDAGTGKLDKRDESAARQQRRGKLSGEEGPGVQAEWDRLDDAKMREKERLREVDEREREVSRREKWVLDEVRRMSDKLHGQANELTLEDRITERLKEYQRQLAQFTAHGNDEGVR
ncbi:hypothetical protein IAU60_004168 [Kwoniella sp. DSM 27419]